MSAFRPYHIVSRERFGRKRWSIWCELSGRRMRSRALPRLAHVWAGRLVFGTQEYGEELVTPYKTSNETARSAAARTRSTLAPKPPAEDPNSN
jgi:hypothetical protein